jgi:5-methylcytosine-specific restriction protein A
MLERLKDRISGRAPKGAKRDPRWPEVRAKHLERYPTCAVCGGDQKIQVHHVIPFWAAPDKELDYGNLITLCVKSNKIKNLNCHLVFGHWGRFVRVNENVKAVAAFMHASLRQGERNG